MSKKAKNIEFGKIVLYKNKLEVQLKADTVWLSQAQIAALFGTKRPAITKHLSNIFKAKELNRVSVCSILEHTANDGKTYTTQFYNLDAIISVGYRVNSTQATQFRVWATKVLKQHLVAGYTINEKRLKKQEQRYLELKNAVNLIGNVIQIESLPVEAKGLAQVISEYTRALDILDDFDHQKLSVPKGKKRSKYKMTYEEARNVIAAMKEKFKDSDIVGQEKDQSFKSSISAIYQSVGGQDAYPTIEEKAAHLLYFVTKNHSFIDGNKRIAAALFICFLERTGILYRKDGSRIIDDNALVALTLMIASSNPKEKDIMVKVIMNLIC
ncbi:MAG: virulence protein RhuM/Fic/DOC family protein [Candidatus Omnitrophica bacterium]|nr:virulence protein RhuM/Fic/DOC family protein [Candidatus Omnitrophota bacterium]